MSGHSNFEVNFFTLSLKYETKITVRNLTFLKSLNSYEQFFPPHIMIYACISGSFHQIGPLAKTCPDLAQTLKKPFCCELLNF